MVNNTTLQIMKGNNKRKNVEKKIKNKCLTLSFIAFTFSHFIVFPSSCNMTTTIVAIFKTLVLTARCCFVFASAASEIIVIFCFFGNLFRNNPPTNRTITCEAVKCGLFSDHILLIYATV